MSEERLIRREGNGRTTPRRRAREVFGGAELEGRPGIQADPSFECLLFPLEGRMPDDWRRFGLEGQLLNLRLLGDLIKKKDEDKP